MEGETDMLAGPRVRILQYLSSLPETVGMAVPVPC
jgi:hypothetical protein